MALYMRAVREPAEQSIIIPLPVRNPAKINLGLGNAALAGDVMGALVDATQPLMEAGLDSLAAVELRSAISSRFGISLPATVALDYPTVKVALVFLCVT